MDFDKQLEQYRRETETLAKTSAEEKKAQMLAAARMNIAKQYLAEKTKILDEVFEKARQQLLELADDDYKKIMKKLMLAAVQSGDEEVIVDSKETRINQDFINALNQQLKSANKSNLKLSDEKQDIGAGFILSRGKIKTNVSIEVLLEQARKELEIQLGKELFEN